MNSKIDLPRIDNLRVSRKPIEIRGMIDKMTDVMIKEMMEDMINAMIGMIEDLQRSLDIRISTTTGEDPALLHRDRSMMQGLNIISNGHSGRSSHPRWLNQNRYITESLAMSLLWVQGHMAKCLKRFISTQRTKSL